MFEWWYDINHWARKGIAVGILLLTTIIFLCGWFWPWGWAVGGVLLLFSGRNDSDKSGYNF